MITEFQKRVYELCKRVPAGKVTTYKAIGDALGIASYRAVGISLNKNPFAPHVPCHRVVASDGSIGGFAHGVGKKVELLREENVLVEAEKIVDFEAKLFLFSPQHTCK